MRRAAPGDRYVDFANHCLQLAAATTDEQSRRMLREMAAKGSNWPRWRWRASPLAASAWAGLLSGV